MPEQQQRILIVDDEAMVRRSVTMVLQHMGYAVEAAAAGPEAMSKVVAQDFTLVFLDYEMDDIRGDELARELKVLKPSLRIVLTTGRAPLALPPEFIGILRKPFSVVDLQAAIAQWGQ